MRLRRVRRSFLIVSAIGGLLAHNAFGVTIYRIGAPFSATERDSLVGLGVDFREFDWSISQDLDGLEMDSLAAGSLQPNFFAEDEDMAASALTRDGWVAVQNFATVDRHAAQVVIDEDPETFYLWPELDPTAFAQSRIGTEEVTIDLGGRFVIREVRLSPSPDNPGHFFEHFTLGVSDHLTRLGNSIPDFPAIAEIKENTEAEVSVFFDPPVTAEMVQLRIFRKTTKEIGLAAFEVFGVGFVREAFFESDVVELDDIASLGDITWAGREDPDARVEIRTRAGSDPHPLIFWEARPEQQDSVHFLDGGGELAFTDYKKQYRRLADILKPVNNANKVSIDMEHWSFWSSPYAFDNPGVSIVSPGPRRYIQFKADFSSTTEDGGKIDYIEFKASAPPLVRDVLGEIFPIETNVGEPTRFTYFLSSTILEGGSGFDGVEIFTPSGVMSVDSLRIDAVDQDFTSSIREDGLGFEVMLPRKLDESDSGAVVEVVFTAPVLREVGSVFSGRVFDTSRPLEVRQRVVPGDAAIFIDSNQLSVSSSLSSALLFSPEVRPNPFTPNGDGINDVMNISYKLLRVTAAVPVAVEIYDFSGRLVRRLYSSDDPLGEYAHTWDGKDNANRFVAPGLYLYRIVVDVQSDQESSSGVVSVAY